MQAAVGNLNAGVVSALHSCKEVTDLQELVQHPGWPELLAILSPIVISTPEVAALWLQSDEHQFDTIMLDDADQMLPHEGLAHLGALACSGKLVAVGGCNTSGTSAFKQLSQQLSADISSRIKLSGNYALAQGLPLPSIVQHTLSQSMAQNQASWRESRLANNLSAAQQALQTAFGSSITSEQLTTVHEDLREMRGGLINIGEAKASISKMNELLYAMPWADVALVASTPAQTSLLRALCLLHKYRSVRVQHVTEVCSASCDIAVLSLTHRVGRSRIGTRTVSGLIQVLQYSARIQVLVIMSGGLNSWTSSGSNSIHGKIGNALQSVLHPSAPPAVSTKEPQWILDVTSRLQVFYAISMLVFELFSHTASCVLPCLHVQNVTSLCRLARNLWAVCYQLFNLHL